ncbi:hypothetical protein BJ742DRAFT_735506 [Cladochytrium replicatum]|nr:hypothetical protein BJ742DRAFT_735506 [Cladochytrium replicatum]
MGAISKRIWHTLATVWGISLTNAIATELLVGCAPNDVPATLGQWALTLKVCTKTLPLRPFKSTKLCNELGSTAMVEVIGLEMKRTHKRFESYWLEASAIGLHHGPQIVIFVIMIVRQAFEDGGSDGSSKSERKIKEGAEKVPKSATPRASTNAASGPNRTNSLYRSMVLLTLYPVMYIILWCPNIVNRILEPIGITDPILNLLQCFSVLEPGANSLVWLVTNFLRIRAKSNSMGGSRASVPVQSTRVSTGTPSTNLMTTPLRSSQSVQQSRTMI